MEAWNNLKRSNRSKVRCFDFIFKYSLKVFAEKSSTQKNQNIEPPESKSHHFKSDLLHALEPISYLSKFCGLLPVKFTLDKDDKFSGQLDSKQVGYGILLALTLAGLQCYGMYRDLRDGWQNSTRLFSKTLITVTSCDVFFVVSVTSYSIFSSTYRWHHMRKALDKIVEADERLDVTTSPHLRKLSIAMMICTLMYLIIISVVDYVTWGLIVASKGKPVAGDKGPINYSPLYFMYIVVVCLQMQYAVVLFNLGERFAKLNKVIENLTRTNAIVEYFRSDMGLAAQERRQQISFGSTEFAQARRGRASKSTGSTIASEGAICGRAASETIDHLINVHDTLCDSITHVNRAYGVILMMCTLSCLLHLVITLYFLYIEVNSEAQRWYIFTRQTFWTIFHLWKMMLFVQPPYSVASKARNTGSLVSQALANNWNPAVQKQLEKFTLQILHRPVEFTACGMFYLDRGLITSIAGAVTTYLVILVQFNSSDETQTKELLQNATELLRNVPGIGGS